MDTRDGEGPGLGQLLGERTVGVLAVDNAPEHHRTGGLGRRRLQAHSSALPALTMSPVHRPPSRRAGGSVGPRVL